MPRKKLPEDKKKIKTGVTLNSELVEIMDVYLKENKINRSKYIENLVKEDFRKMGKISEDYDINNLRKSKIDDILDKISEFGLDGLSVEDKELLG